MKFPTSTGPGRCRGTGLLSLQPLRRVLRRALLIAGGLALGLPCVSMAQTADDLNAIVTWGPPMVSANPSAGNRINNQTVRQIAHISAGGARVRVKFSNRWNPQPLVIGGAQVAVRTTGSAIDPGTSRTLTFSGSTSFTMPPNSELLSDWVDLTVDALSDLAVDLYLPGDTSAAGSVLSVRNGALQTNYIATAAGNNVGAQPFPTATTRGIWQFLSAIDVVQPLKKGAVVAFGDSITEGLTSTSDSNSRWPDVLARRLSQAGIQFGVANVGISGNTVTSIGSAGNPSAMARMDQEVLAHTGVTHIIVLLGINDASSMTDTAIIAALQQIVMRARTQQLKIYLGTLTPFGNASATVKARRTAINNWIRTTREIDGYIDFDAAVRNPANPEQFAPGFNNSDTLHPNNAGLAAMGNAIDLALFQ